MGKNLIRRVVNRIYTQYVTPLQEKKFKMGGGTEIKYLFYPNKGSKVLIVGFQACHKDGARYNYVTTLRGLECNRLYIKDDFAANHRGNYYIGRGQSGEYDVEPGVNELIQKMVNETNADKIIFIGSSKGAYAAVNFLTQYKGAIAVIASPQYYLGNYLNCDHHMDNLISIVGEPVTDEKVAELNQRLKKKIQRGVYGETQKVYIHYSVNDLTYDEHIKDMLEDLRAVGIDIVEDIGNYEIHEELKYYFPDFLINSISEILSC